MNIDKIKVISADKDGADLRRERREPWHTRCDGDGDNEQIQGAIDRVGKSVYGPLGDAYDRIDWSK